MQNNQITMLQNNNVDNGSGFPLHIYPEPLREFIRDTAESMNCPPDFIAMSVLSSFSLAIGSKVVAQVKKGWKESPVLFSAIVAEPGAKKTPSLVAGAFAVFQVQKEFACIYATEKEAYKKNKEEFDKALEDWKSLPKTKRKSEDKPIKPNTPTIKQITTSDTTIEGLSSLLKKEPLGILFVQDELAGWVKGMNQYRQGNGADQEKWLSLWSCQDIVINRKSEDEPIYIHRPFVSVLGCLQPDILDEFSQGKDNGFLDRILFSIPNSVKLEYTHKEVDEELIQDYLRVFKKIYFIKPESEDPIILKFSSEAQLKFEDYLNNSHYEEMNSDELPYYLKGIWSKLVGYTVRFSLIIEAIKHGYNRSEFKEIDVKSLEKAIELTEYFKIQAKKVQNILHSTPMDKKVEKAIIVIKKKGGTIKLRDIYINKIAGCRNKKEAGILVNEMQDRSLIEIKKSRPKTGGKETISIHLSSIIHQSN